MSRDIMAVTPRLRFLVYWSLFAVVPWLPLRCCQLGGWLIGWCLFCCDPAGRRQVQHNIRGAVPPDRRHQLPHLVRRSYCRFGLACAEGLHATRMPRYFVAPDQCRVIDPWRVLPSDGPLRGPAVYSLPHCNWELLPVVMSMLDLIDRVHVISLTHEDPRIDELFFRHRQALGVESLLLDRGPLATLRALRDGAVVGLVGDRDYTAHGVAVQLLGRPARVPVGPAVLALQAGVPIQPIMLARDGYTRTRLIMGRPLRADPRLSKRDQTRQLSQLAADWYSRCIRTVPDQWVVFHDQWGMADRNRSQG